MTHSMMPQGCNVRNQRFSKEKWYSRKSSGIKMKPMKQGFAPFQITKSQCWKNILRFPMRNKTCDFSFNPGESVSCVMLYLENFFLREQDRTLAKPKCYPWTDVLVGRISSGSRAPFYFTCLCRIVHFR